MNPDQKVVTRFAPSPTGFMHVGNVRTALYAWLFARHHRGTFILRIEDTDKEREVEGSIEHITKTLSWLGITWDEGVGVGGPHGPYIQSERLESYKKYARLLIGKGFAYPDPYTEDEVESFRQKAEAEKRPFLYRDHRPQKFDTWDGSRPLRFCVPEIKRYEWHDLVQGDLSAGEEALDDFILIKSDGYPTYNFAHIVDDYEMGVTHIMRAQEFISSTPKFLSLYSALGITPPQLATMPPILASGGKKKLGKRDGAKDILGYCDDGYIPEAMVNFLAFIGWNPGDEREIMSIDEIIEAFSLEHVHRAGAQFNEEKLLWFNQKHLQLLSRGEYCSRLRAFMEAHQKEVPTYLECVAHLLISRSQTLAEAADLLVSDEFLFIHATITTPTKEALLQQGKLDAAISKNHLQKLSELLMAIDDRAGSFTEPMVKSSLMPYADQWGRGAVLWPLRVALSGQEKSPDPFTIAGLIGKEKTLARIEQAIALL